MIQRPPACERHAAELPGKAHIVDPEECPWCWQEQKEQKKMGKWKSPSHDD